MPLVDLVGHLRYAHAEDERQPRVPDRPPVRIGDHSRIRDHCDVGQPVRGHERLNHPEDGLGLGPVAFERLDHQRKPGSVGQQPDGDPWIQRPFLGEPRLSKPVPGVGLEVQRGHDSTIAAHPVQAALQLVHGSAGDERPLPAGGPPA